MSKNSKILLVSLVVLAVLGLIVFFYVKNKASIVSSPKNTELTQQQKVDFVKKLNSTPNITPLSAKEKTQILKQLSTKKK